MKIRDMALCGLFAALLAICAWISIPLGPGGLSISLQTFGVFLTLGLLGGKRGTVTIAIYLLLGAVGAPVFSGFRGGLGVLLGLSGGYLFGFLLMGLIYCLIPKKIPAMLIGLFACYVCGIFWDYGFSQSGADYFFSLAFWHLSFFLLPDLLKLVLALALTERLQHHL
jgi:biotin transport system substrate-specific component